jgi:putative thioredoxin
MTQQPFTRPGAIDLSALKGAPGPGAPGSAGPGGPGAGSAAAPEAAVRSAYCVDITAQNFQSVVETSTTAPVLLVFYSPSQMPESAQLADDLETLAGEFEGKFLAGRVDIDAVPQIAQGMQIPSIPLVVVIVDGRPMPLLQDAVPLEELRTTLTQVMQQLTTQGITGRHQPRTGAAPAEGEDADEMGDPRYAAAQDAMGEGDIDTAVAEYQKLVDANPADA